LDFKNWTSGKTIPTKHTDIITCVTVQPDGTLITGSKDKSVRSFKRFEESV